MSSSRDQTLEILGELQTSMGNMGQTIDEIRTTMAAQGATQEEINSKLDVIMAQQQADTTRILSSINMVMGQVSQMWANTASWLSNIQQQLNVLGSMMEGLGNAIQTLLARVEELVGLMENLGTRIDWGSVVSALTEYQMRVTYATEMVTNIYVGSTEGGDTAAPESQYDALELEKWADKTVDLATGLGYYLEAVHRLIIGDFTLGKPLMLLYCKLFSQQTPADPKVVRFYGYLVAVQAQGYAVLAKAREYRGMRPIDTTKILNEKLKTQAQAVMESFTLASGVPPGGGVGGWIGATGTEMVFPRDLKNHNYDIYMMVPSNDKVMCGIRLGDEWFGDNWAVTFPYLWIEYGNVIPGTTLVENVGSTRQPVGDNMNHQNHSFVTTFAQSISAEDLTQACYNSTPLTVGPEWAIVGLKLQGTKPPRIQPVVSRFDPATGKHEWNGSGSGAYVAWVGSGDQIIGGQDLSQGKVHFFAEADNNPNRTRGMMRGIRVSYDPAPVQAFRIMYQSTGLNVDTWLPFEYQETPGIQYEPVTLPGLQ
ncbi:hypothetical protein V8F20_008970 [Naviculisporaceae sp. PSN 640]